MQVAERGKRKGMSDGVQKQQTKGQKNRIRVMWAIRGYSNNNVHQSEDTDRTMIDKIWHRTSAQKQA